jgi:3-dehydroquinate dehydratase/shikimate dehydrogenase
MRVASIICNDIHSAKTQIQKVLAFCDIIELRLDYLEHINIAEIRRLRKTISLPVIFTLRKKSQGGQSVMPELKRLAMMMHLASLRPDYMDIEFDTPDAYLQTLKKNFPKIHIIGSYHDFKKTPKNLERLFARLHKPYFDSLKIATFAHDICDSLRFLVFLKKISKTHRITGMTMGEYGETTRILSPIVGSLMTYGSVDTASMTAPGQLTVQEMTEIYHAENIDQNTGIYALLGYPVAQSIGHIFHNQRFAKKKQNAVYVKLKIAPELLSQSIGLLKQLPFVNFSVTIPHKETIMAHLDHVQENAMKMGAVNTVVVQGEKYRGFNTDGIASVDVLSKKTTLKNKKILILGAGGSAKAIVQALSTEGAKITICNRTLARAEAVAKNQGADSNTITFLQLFALKKTAFDIILNTLPADAFAAHCADWKIPLARNAKKIAMDIALQPSRAKTVFLTHAAAAGYLCISGEALFKAQAIRQARIWAGTQKKS